VRLLVTIQTIIPAACGGPDSFNKAYGCRRKPLLSWSVTGRFIVDPDVLTEMVWRLSLFYGKCLVAGEINSDRGTLMSIHQRGGRVYFQKQWNNREQKETNSMGWKTDENSRKFCLAEIGKGIREYANIDPMTGHSKERIEIYLAPVLDELEAFVRLSSGREEAMSGKHDDHVLGSSIGLCCLDQATTYHVVQGQMMNNPGFGNEDGQETQGRVKGTYT
jgi:hypothetical protein